MSTVKSYRELIAWQKAMKLVFHVYRCTQNFPKDELYGLVSQMRRSAVSVPSNIAEGQGRSSTGEFKQFLGHAKGSLFELETQVLIASELGYFAAKQGAELLEMLDEAGRLISGLVNSLERASEVAAGIRR